MIELNRSKRDGYIKRRSYISARENLFSKWTIFLKLKISFLLLKSSLDNNFYPPRTKFCRRSIETRRKHLFIYQKRKKLFEGREDGIPFSNQIINPIQLRDASSLSIDTIRYGATMTESERKRKRNFGSVLRMGKSLDKEKYHGTRGVKWSMTVRAARKIPVFRCYVASLRRMIWPLVESETGSGCRWLVKWFGNRLGKRRTAVWASLVAIIKRNSHRTGCCSDG